MDLHQLQQLFLSYIHDKRGNHQQLMDICIEPERGNIYQRLDIYNNNYFASLLTILKKTYQVCLQLVGEEFFISMSNIFIKQTPSTSVSLDDYGKQFAFFIEQYPPANCLPYLADVARLEWAWAKAYFGPDVGCIDYDKFVSLKLKMANKLVFDLPANITLLQSQFPIDQIWQLHQKNSVLNHMDINLEPTQMQCIVWRRQLEVLIERCTVEEWKVLKLFYRGATLDEVCENMSDKGIEMATILPALIRKGWLSGFHYK